MRETANKREGKESVSLCLNGDFNGFTLNCEDSAGLLTSEMRYLLSVEMMG